MSGADSNATAPAAAAAAAPDVELTALPTQLSLGAHNKTPASGPATSPAADHPAPLSLAYAADAKERADDPRSPVSPASPLSPSEEAAQRVQTPKKTVYVLSEAEKKAVRDVLNPANADPHFLDAMNAWSDGQTEYYLDLMTAADVATLNARAERFVKGDVEAEPPVTLAWKNLSYTKVGETAPRLHNVSGVLRPKQTICILGGPDAGITSLLMVLAGRNQAGAVTGDVLINGQKPDTSIHRRVGLVPKDDIHLASLSTQETLEFSARLRLPNVIPDRVKRIRARSIMKLLGLRHAAHTVVGSDTIRGISGGEKRRLSIGVEWVAGHKALLMDLPTNGLDSASAYDVINTYKFLAQSSRRGLMCSLVQPSPELLDLFDTVLLMSKGYVAYYGPRGAIMHYFFGLGYQMPVLSPEEAADKEAIKSEPDYLAELSVQPERFYQGDGVTDEKGQIVVKPYTAKPNPYSLTQSNANVVLTDDSNSKPLDGTVAVASEVDLDDIAAPENGAAHVGGDVRVHIPRKSVVGAVPVPALSGGVVVDGRASPPSSAAAELKHGSIAVSVSAAPLANGNGHGNGSEFANGNVVGTKRDATDAFGGKDPNAPKANRTISVKGHKVRVTHLEGMQHLLQAWTQSDYKRQMELDVSTPMPADWPKADPETATAAHVTSFVHQLALTMHRQGVLVWRDTTTTMGQIMQAIIMALLVGSLFWDIGTNQKDMRTRFGLFFFVLMQQIMDSLSAIPGLMDQRLNYYNQTNAGWYRGAAWYFSYVTARLPLNFATVFLFLIILYPMSGLTGGIASGEFGYLLLLVIITAQCGKAWCLFIAAISPNQPIAMALTPITMIMFTMFCGFMVPRDSIPNGWIWVYYLSFFTWAVRGAAQNELVPLTFYCNPDELLQISAFANPVCPIPDGTAALAQYDMDPTIKSDGTPDGDEKWTSMLNLFWFLLAFNVAACLALLRFHWYHNDSSHVGSLNDDEDDEVIDDAAVADAGSSTPRRTPRSKRSGTPKRKRSASQRKIAGAHVINVQPAEVVAAPVAAPAREYDMKVTPTSLSFHNLTYSINLPNQKAGTPPKELLINTFGFVKPGQCMALMGPSGAGKSTLLDVLANKKNGGFIKGSLLINGKPRDKDFQLISGYVEQTDSHNPFSTVREAIEFSARLRLPPAMTEHEKMERVEAVLDKLGLRPFANQQIGSVEMGGVSPEIRKKVTIGVELVMNPAILFLDEPTTGLDSMAAMAVMDAVRKLASTISVVCTVHQPSAEIVEKFDTMLLMQKGGHVAYCGPIHNGVLSKYLGSVGLGECPEGRNIADHVLEVAGGGIKHNAAGKALGPDPSQLFLASPQCAGVKAELTALGHNVNSAEAVDIPLGDGVKRGWLESDTTADFSTQFKELTVRSAVSIYRDTPTFRGRMSSAVIIAFILSTLYYQLGFGQADAANRVSLFYLTGLFPCFSAGEIIPKIIGFRPIYFRERQAKMYSAEAYFLGRLVGQLPYIFIESTIYCVVMYFVANLRRDDASEHFWVFYATYIIMRLAGFAFAELMASALEKAEAASAAQGVLLTLFMLFAGFLVPKTGIPAGWQWMYYLSLFRYPISLLANNELRGLDFECADNKGAIGPLDLFNRTATSDALTQSCTTPSEAAHYSDPNCFGYICPYTSGNQMLKSFDMDGDSVGEFYAIIAGMVVFYQLLNLYVLKKVQHIKR